MNIFYMSSCLSLLLGVSGLLFLKKVQEIPVVPISSNYQPPVKETKVEVQVESGSAASDIYLTSIYFSLGSTKLNLTQKNKLNALISLLSNTQKVAYILDGYTDSTGSGLVDNDLLATLRAYSVFEHLSHSGIKRENIFIRTYGLHNPTTDSKTNRKVDIYIAEAGNP